MKFLLAYVLTAAMFIESLAVTVLLDWYKSSFNLSWDELWWPIVFIFILAALQMVLLIEAWRRAFNNQTEWFK